MHSMCIQLHEEWAFTNVCSRGGLGEGGGEVEGNEGSHD